MSPAARIAGKGRPAITAQMKLAVLRAWGALVKCVECLDEYGLSSIQFDHHQALVDGGEHTVENLRPVCLGCHRRKSAFEHTRNSKSKRLAAARQIHEAAKRGEYIRPPSKVRPRQFDKALRRRMNGKVERRV